MKNALTLAALAATLAFGILAHGAEPKIRVLPNAEDATKKPVLVGRNITGNMIVIFELEPAKGMWMQMGSPPRWVEHPIGKGEVFHVDVRPVDPESNTRISYAEVKFSAVNRNNKKKLSGTLHPMWGRGGLHYCMNSPLAGDGTYEAMITVGVPAFARASQDKDLWTKPVTTKFHFKLAGGKLTEVTEPQR